MVIDQFVQKIDAKYTNFLDVKGKLYIHQPNADIKDLFPGPFGCGIFYFVKARFIS